MHASTPSCKMPLTQKEHQPQLEKFSEVDIIQHELSEMVLLQHQMSSKPQNLEELLEQMTYNKSEEPNDQNIVAICNKNLKKVSLGKKPKKFFVRKFPKRQDNSITSNTVRLLKLCIKETFFKLKEIYESFVKFYQMFSIRSQLWAFDAILIYTLYMRDQRDEKNQKEQQVFQSLHGLILDRLTLIEYRSNNLLIKERIVRYKAHCQLYFHENRSFKKLTHMEDEIHDFFQSLISKKKLVISNCMDMIKKIIRLIESQHYHFKKSQEVNKTPQRKPKHRKVKHF